MFCTPDNQIYPKDVFLRHASYRQLIAIKIPFYFFVTRVSRWIFDKIDRRTLVFPRINILIRIRIERIKLSQDQKPIQQMKSRRSKIHVFEFNYLNSKS